MRGFDLSTLDVSGAAEEGKAMEVRHPVTGEPLTYTDEEGERPVTITLLGMESDTAKRAQRDAQRRRLRKGMIRFTPEELESEAMSLLVALTKSWDGVEWQGALVPCTASNVRMVYGACGWLRKQVDEFVGDLQNYVQGN